MNVQPFVDERYCWYILLRRVVSKEVLLVSEIAGCGGGGGGDHTWHCTQACHRQNDNI